MEIVGFKEFETIYNKIKEEKQIKTAKLVTFFVVLSCILTIIFLITSIILWNFKNCEFNNTKLSMIFFGLFYIMAWLTYILNRKFDDNTAFNNLLSYDEIDTNADKLKKYLKDANINGICDIITRRTDKKIGFYKSLWVILTILILPFFQDNSSNLELMILSLAIYALGILIAFIQLLSVIYPLGKTSIMNEYLAFLNQYKSKDDNK